MQPIERSSNWDFTPVISLLHSPAYGGGNSSAPPRHTDSGTKANDRVDNVDSQGNVNGAKQHPRLGDFGSLWGLLGHTSTASSEKTHRTDHHSRVATSRPSADRPNQITILKRPSNNVNNTDTPPKVPPQSSKSIPVPGTSQPRKSKGKADRCTGIDDCDAGNKASSENNSSLSTEADSDGSLSVFDLPLQKPATSLIPPQVAPTTTKTPPLVTPPSSYDSVESTLKPETVKSLPKDNHVRPTYKSTKERKIGLLTKLLKAFPDYADIMSQVGRPARNKANGSSSHPVHVFVDLSNIMVGFHDSMKASRGIPIPTRIPRLPFSFENFSLVLERGRKAEKRVLVGSDRYREIDEAEKAGYETNILDRVQKGRYLAQRPLRSRKGQRLGTKETIAVSETNGVAEERWVEQGVDEILHLKILESLVDTDKPATIALATGDAAEAEYSEGFMKMVERALKRGWIVELVSFSQTTSSAYRDESFQKKWQGRFKMIKLDDYMEELLDM